MMDTNTLVISKDNYKTSYDFEDAIKKAITLLLDANYIMTVSYEEAGLGIVRIDYEHADKSFGCDYPYWLSPEEFESVVRDCDKEGDDNTYED